MSTSIHEQNAHFSDRSTPQVSSSRLDNPDLHELRQHGYDYCYLNLLSIFGDTLSLEKIRMLAAECTSMRLRQGSEFYSFLSQLPALLELQRESDGAGSSALPLKLQGWDLDLLRSVLNRGKGLILCAHHFGLYRYIFIEMALLGFKMWSFIDKASYDQSIEAIEAVNCGLLRGSADGIAREDTAMSKDLPMNLLCVDDHNFARKVATGLRRNEIVLVFIDGNTGWDGPWGNKSKTVIEFLNYQIAVKNGVARLAATLKAPLLSILTPRRTDDSGQAVFGQPIIPPAVLSRVAREDFIRDAMQSLYDHLAEFVLERPEQWESSRSFHRWRVPSPQSTDSDSVEEEKREVARLLKLGATFNINENRFAHFDSQGETVWIDVKRLKIYRHSERVENILQVITQQKGINQTWIDRQGGELYREEEILTILSHLKKLDFVLTR